MIEAERTAQAADAPDWRSAVARADARVELAAVRTGLALERTRMSADRTLMAVMRTGLGLIGVGFAIFEYFHVAQLEPGATRVFSPMAARTVAFALVALGLGVLGPGIVSHRLFLRRLRRHREALALRGLAPPALDVPGSIATTLAVLFFALGVIVIVRMAYRAGLLG